MPSDSPESAETGRATASGIELQTSYGPEDARPGRFPFTRGIYPEMYRRPATAAGASLLAGELLRDGGIVYHPAGGTHHGLPARANVFCYLNDPVLAILSLRRNGVERIAVAEVLRDDLPQPRRVAG